MTDQHSGNRRRFVKICASAVAAVSANPRVLASEGGSAAAYNHAVLVGPDRRPLGVDEIAVGETYLFHYPYISTPCFLLDLGDPAVADTDLETEAGQRYRWRGGVGPKRSIVAFSAICAHRMSHPTREVNFINYRHQEVSFIDAERKRTSRAQVIHCCSERSVYDPARGAAVLGGPARQPLAAILLDYDSELGTLTAVGTDGGEMFDRYFDTFAFRLFLEFGTSEIRRRTTDTAMVQRLDDYCRQKVLC